MTVTNPNEHRGSHSTDPIQSVRGSPTSFESEYESGSVGAGETSGEGEHVREQGRQTKEELKQQGQDLAEEGREVARELGSQAQHAAEGFIFQAVEQIGGIADALEVAARELRNNEQDPIADQAEAVAQGLDRLSQRLANNDLDTLADDARNWARDNPAAFLGGSVAVGFALSRLFKASGRGESQGQAESQSTRDALPEEDPLVVTDDSLRPGASASSDVSSGMSPTERST